MGISDMTQRQNIKIWQRELYSKTTLKNSGGGVIASAPEQSLLH